MIPLFNDKSILVTGGAGFIGSHLVEQLVSEGACVTVVDNFATGNVENLKGVQNQITLVVGDIGDLLRLKRVQIHDFCYVFHLAANPYIPPSVENPEFDLYENLQNTFMLLEALRSLGTDAPRLVNVSSAAVYGNPTRLPIRESDPTVPISPYGVSKLAAERYVAVYSAIYGLHASSMRCFSVYGPRQRKQVVFDFMRKLDTDPTRLEIIGDGTQARDFTFVTDVVQAMLLAATVAPGRGEAYNVGTGTTHTIAQLAQAVADVCGVCPQLVYTGRVRPGDAQTWEVDITALEALGYKPQVALMEGLRRIREWYNVR